MSKEQEYREIFHAEAIENQEELNRLFTVLEKDHGNKKSVDAIFRITHTLKGNALGMGFKAIGAMAHALEDVFGEIRSGNLVLDDEIFRDLYKGLDTLSSLIDALKTDEKVKYLGIKAKLGVILRKAKEEQDGGGEESSAEEKPVAEAPKKEEKPKEEPVKEEVVEEIKAAPEELKEEVGSKVEPVAENSESNENKNEENAETEPVQEQSEELKEEEESAEIQQEEVVEEAVEVEVVPVEATEEIEEEEEEEEENSGEEEAPKITFSDLVQVPVRKLDELMNLVGELVIERDRIIALTNERTDSTRVDFSRFIRITSDLQYAVMDVRLVQVAFLFNKFHRVVRDAADSENKKVNLELEGTDTEIDRNVLSIISDSMIHLVRNCVGHGIELPEVRKQKGKDEYGTITLKARNENDNVIIEIVDNGAGIDPKIIAKKAIEKGLTKPELLRNMTDKEIIMFIFEPGFSSMDTVTAISGRGVGMDVVKKSIDSIGGTVEVESKVGQGTTIKLFLPSSMAVKGSLLFELGGQEYAIPLAYTEAVVSYTKKDIHKVGEGLMATYLDKTISIVWLRDVFQIDQDMYEVKSGLHTSFDKIQEDQQLDVVVVSYGGKDVGFVVDKLLQQKEIVEKPLMKPVDHVKMISGVTILGNGKVCLVLNVINIVQHIFHHGSRVNMEK